MGPSLAGRAARRLARTQDQGAVAVSGGPGLQLAGKGLLAGCPLCGPRHFLPLSSPLRPDAPVPPHPQHLPPTPPAPISLHLRLHLSRDGGERRALECGRVLRHRWAAGEISPRGHPRSSLILAEEAAFPNWLPQIGLQGPSRP